MFIPREPRPVNDAKGPLMAYIDKVWDMHADACDFWSRHTVECMHDSILNQRSISNEIVSITQYCSTIYKDYEGLGFLAPKNHPKRT